MKPDTVVSSNNTLPFFLPVLSHSLFSTINTVLWAPLAVGELASFPGRLVGHSQDAGRLLHHPDQEVVNVVLQLPDVGVLPPKKFFVLHQLLQHLLIGQTPVPSRGIERIVVLE